MQDLELPPAVNCFCALNIKESIKSPLKTNEKANLDRACRLLFEVEF
jgi:hypothetical protein